MFMFTNYIEMDIASCSMIIILLILLIIFAPWSYCEEDNMLYSECVNPFNCGSLTNLSYPFWTGRSQICGSGGFHLQCTDDDFPVITIENQSFLVLSIDQSQKEMAIVRMDVLGDACPNDLTSFRNITLNAARFSFVPDFYSKFSNITIFYNCTDLQTPDTSLRFLCAINGEVLDAFYAYDGLQGGLMSETSKCNIKVEIPVLKSSIGKHSSIALREGFNVSYKYDEGCVRCRASGGICGTNLTTWLFTCLCRDHPYPLSCPNKPDSDRSGKTKVLIVAMATVVTLFTAGFIYLFMRNRSLAQALLRKNQDFEAFLESQGRRAVKRYNYSQVKKITNSFKEKLGQGGYGSVYKGKISDDRFVAVKILKVSEEELGEDFINEVSAISTTSHVNIVTLLGFCLEGEKRALVYEFMPNGSLDKFICHKTTLVTDQHLGVEVIEQIAIGIAQGLEYLHRGCNTRIVHFDIKPHNILLDENLNPKISDFGLAKLCTRKESIISMLEARGTIGYIAPEVFSRNFGLVSSKSDVYSYGMMILEIIGARKKDEQVEGSNSIEMYFPSWIYKSLESENGKDAISEDDKEGEVVMKLKLVGLWCIQTNPLDRPSMSKVIEMLRGSTQTISIPPKPFLFSSSSAPPIQLSSYSSTT